jgi:hypothetical protein
MQHYTKNEASVLEKISFKFSARQARIFQNIGQFQEVNN